MSRTLYQTSVESVSVIVNVSTILGAPGRSCVVGSGLRRRLKGLFEPNVEHDELYGARGQGGGKRAVGVGADDLRA